MKKQIVFKEEPPDIYYEFEKNADKETQKVIDVARKRGLRIGLGIGVFCGALGATGVWLRVDGYRLLSWLPMAVAFLIALLVLGTKIYENDPNS